MSHVVALDVVIHDLEALKRAVKNLGLEWREGQTTYKWYGRWVNDYNSEDAAYNRGVNTADYGKNSLHAISVPGNNHAYEIGVVQRRDSDGNPLPGYTLVYDFFAGGKGMSEYVGGQDCGKLIAQYSKEALIAEAQQQGYSVNETTDAAGNIVLAMEDYNYA